MSLFFIKKTSFIQKICVFQLFLCLSYSWNCQAQSVYIPLNQDYYHLIERYEIKSGKLADEFHGSIKPILREGVVNLAESILEENQSLSNRDYFNLQYLKNDNWEWTKQIEGDSKKDIFNFLYKKQSDFYHYRSKDFEVHINPLLNVGTGVELEDLDFGNSEIPYHNTRGIEVRGMIDKKIGFYSMLTDNQILFPKYVTNRITEFNAVPNEGFYKRNPGEDDVDFITARGYITFDITKHIHLQFGHDKNFIGNGYRSLTLSDYASNYTFLKLNTCVWKLNYQNIFGQMTAEVLNADGLRPKKFFAMHHLSINLTDNFNLGFFEAVVFARDTTQTNNNQFDLNYLNPIIFYRSVEQQLGSPDNAVLGMDFKWNLWRRLSLYGQFFLDEFLISDIRAGNGSVRNKFAGQLGFRYIDVAGVSNLDLQGEINFARPYTYSHNFTYREYSHYNQPLAHPLGANFQEIIGIIRYQPFPRWQFVGKGIFAEFGTDGVGENWGGNIFKNNSDFEQETGNSIGQGINNQLLYLNLTISWQMKHNLFLDANQTIRRLNSDNSNLDRNTTISYLTLRWNLPQRLNEF